MRPRTPTLAIAVALSAPAPGQTFDLLLTEVMSDPTPAVGLPDVEYVELYNATAGPVDLTRFSLLKGASAYPLPDTTLAPGAYLALAGAGEATAPFVAYPDLPALTNTGALLSLRDTAGALVDQVAYDPDWHAAGKRDGGWSLERRDVDAPCLLGADGWASSARLSGGSPGEANDATALLPDSLRFLSAYPLSDGAVRLALNVHVSTSDLLLDVAPLAEYTVVATDTLGVYALRFAAAANADAARRLALDPATRTCLGPDAVPVSRERIVVGTPAAPRAGDWQLSEIMYDPRSGEGRWIELANVSDRLLDLADVRIARADSAGGVRALFGAARLLVPPGGYAVLAADAVRLAQAYPSAPASRIVEADVPTLGESECLMAFDARSEDIFWRVCYAADWHNAGYADTDGVSLERIDLDAPAQRPENWTSAASSVDFATPGERNSQARDADAVVPTAPFTLERERVSPDGDGYEDLLAVAYAPEAPGTLARFSVVTLDGAPARTFPAPLALASAGRWTYDATDDDGDYLPDGTYVLRVSYWTEGTPERQAFLPFSVVSRR